MTDFSNNVASFFCNRQREGPMGGGHSLSMEWRGTATSDLTRPTLREENYPGLLGGRYWTFE